MPESKRILFIVGEKEEDYYRPVLNLLKKKGLTIDVGVFSWNYNTQEDWVNQISKKCDIKNSYIFGFSISAFLALLLISKYGARGAILVSPTPLFSDTRYPEKVKKILGQRRLNIAKQTHIEEIRIDTDKKTYLLLGEQEDHEMIRQCYKLIDLNKKKVKLKKIKNTAHSTTSPEMLKAIESIIPTL